ncbi:hypothetical protein [Solimonas terrae]|uniref:Uncharacterized protein n=1 Tax=Solimonas terrae TaxID=1396819 RepID=A0A6M2BV59_9GAMM|nr:hypothetical protein [Solimonas terrae]NGY06081.1 hypothetical protein [Solimonas terrae]
MPRIIAALLLLAFAAPAGAATPAQPCEKAAEPLMSVTSSWAELYTAGSHLPAGCFDGYFAEGISDTIIRKIGTDWPGFIAVLLKHSNSKKFFGLVLDSFNATVDEEDIQTANRLALRSCPSKLKIKCLAISQRAKEALASYDPPLKPSNR